MNQYTTYDAATGRILAHYSSDMTLSFKAPTIAGHYDGASQYVSGGTVTARPAMTLTADKTSITANGTDTATITGFPAGSTLVVDGGAAQALGTLTSETFQATSPGTYTLVFSQFPHLDATLTITAS